MSDDPKNEPIRMPFQIEAARETAEQQAARDRREQLHRIMGTRPQSEPFLERLYLLLDDRVRILEQRSVPPPPAPQPTVSAINEAVSAVVERAGRLEAERAALQGELTKERALAIVYHEFFYRIAKHVEGDAPTATADFQQRAKALFVDARDAVKELEAKVAGIV